MQDRMKEVSHKFEASLGYMAISLLLKNHTETRHCKCKFVTISYLPFSLVVFFFINTCTRDLICFCLLPGEFLSFADDLLSGLGTSCVAAGRSHGEVPEVSIYSVIFKCLEPDGLYK